MQGKKKNLKLVVRSYVDSCSRLQLSCSNKVLLLGPYNNATHNKYLLPPQHLPQGTTFVLNAEE
jgi:hypothetical protein